VAAVREDKRTRNHTPTGQGLDKLKTKRSVVPAITHVDYSARVQTVDPLRHARLYDIMQRFKEKTDCPVIINTSFNIRGEPIVCTPEQAYHCFLATQMDVLVLENFVLYKEEQPEISSQDIKDYQAQFKLD
jgi:carbamoyltransferase